MSRWFPAVLWLLVVGGVADVASAERLRIVVGGANFRPYPIGAPDIVAGSKSGASKKAAKRLTGVLQAGVDLARPLELVPIKTYLAPHKESWTAPKYQNWMNVGASGLIRASVTSDGKKSNIVFRFFDVVGQRELLSRTLKGPTKDDPELVHRFLDEVIELLTGEKGIFSSKIAFIKRSAKSNKKAVYVAGIDGRGERRVTDARALSLLPAWSPTGKHLLFTSFMKDNADIWRLDLATKKLEWLSHREGINSGAAVSPDGKRIALTLSTDGNTEVYAMDWNGKNLTRLTDNWGQDMSPSWSPDGKQIAFVSSRSGNPHIYVMPARGGTPRRLTFQGNYNQEPDWSPRGDGRIAFTARDERLKFDIFAVDPKSSEITRLTQDQGNNESPAHSPDGHHLVFTSTRGKKRNLKKLYVMDVDGNHQRKISRDDGHYEDPTWGPRLGY